MATRLYLPSSGASPITPAFDAGWDVSGDADRLRAKRAPQNTTETNITRDETSATADIDVLARQYVYGPIGAHTFGGTVKGQVAAGQNNLNRDLRAQMVIRVVSSDGLTFRGTVLDYDTDALGSPAGSEFATSTVNRPFPRDGAVACAAIVAQEGDYVVIEVGYRSHNTITTASTGTFLFGDENSDTDLPEDSTTSGANSRPWIEFSQDLPIPAADTYDAAIRDRIPYSYYKLTETSGTTLADTAQAYDMTITGAPTLDQAGPFGGWKAALFDGVDDFASANVIDYSGVGTVIGWARTSDLVQAHSEGWWNSSAPATPAEGVHTLENDDNGAGDKWQVHYSNSALDPIEIEGPAAVVDTWIFWALTAGAGGLKFWIAVAGDVTQQGATDTTTDILTFQVHRFCADKNATIFGNWLVSRTAVFHTELTEAQLQTIYDAAAGGGAVQLNLGGSITGAGALTKRVGQTRSGSTTGVGVLTGLTRKTLTGSVTGSGSLIALGKFIQNLAGSLTPSGTLQRRTSKVIAGSVSGAGIVTKKTRKTLGGSAAGSGTLVAIRKFIRSFTGAIDGSGALTRKLSKVVGGSVTAAGGLTRKTSKVVTGSIAQSGSVAKQIQKTLAGSIATAGTVSAVKVVVAAVQAIGRTIARVAGRRNVQSPRTGLDVPGGDPTREV